MLVWKSGGIFKGTHFCLEKIYINYFVKNGGGYKLTHTHPLKSGPRPTTDKTPTRVERDPLVHGQKITSTRRGWHRMFRLHASMCAKVYLYSVALLYVSWGMGVNGCGCGCVDVCRWADECTHKKIPRCSGGEYHTAVRLRILYEYASVFVFVVQAPISTAQRI